MIDVERNELVFEVAVGGGTPAVQGLRLKLGQGIAGWVAETGEVAVVSDVARDPRWYRAADSRSGFQTRAIVAVPIEVKGRRLGVIEAINPAGGGTFGEADVAMVRSLAGLAGSAITNAQAYAALQAAEDRYAALFEDSVDPILITDMAGTITEANRKACDFLGYERDDLIGMNVSLVHRMGTGLIGEQRLAHVQSGAELIFKTRAWTKTGREVPVEVHANRIRRGGQEFLQWIEHDITERVQLEEMREDLLAMIFHDLRAPLGNVLSSLEMLEAALPRDEGSAVLAPLVEIALRSSQRLSHLLNSLLDLRRLESGQAILDKEPAELLVLMREAVDQIQPNAEARAVALKLDLPPRVPLLLLDSDMVRRVLINLLDNAVKYTPPGSRVTVQVSAPPREPVTVAIADEGTGVAAEHEHMIFEKFNRVQREGGPKGLGLGLAFCRLAIEAHGGRIWVEGAPGRGATFKFTLPV
jgi:PAS domain S-box-containing protein